MIGLNERYKQEIVTSGAAVLENRFRYFFDKNYDLGSGPDWFLNPVTGKRASSNKHWCDIDLFDPEVGDIKFIWEPSRFGWVYTLVRSYAATGDNKYAEKFWSLFESWLETNQPNMGPNYACGQECAIRLMAMCFAFYGFSEAEASTVERMIRLVTAIAVHADRIEKNIGFAISTRTNHSLTEAAGLYTAGILFPEFERSDRWFKLGKKVLTSEGLKQIYPDGSYIQHSMNYHRLMLQDFLWVLRLAQLNGDSFGVELEQLVQKAGRFLFEMQDATAGRVPNYGANDGTLIIPLNSCDYPDYRPVLQATNYLFTGKRLYEKGPWDEDLVWFFGPKALGVKIKAVNRTSGEYQSGGYYTLRNNDSWSMMRCHSYFDRPGQADMLHLDLWWRGVNVLRDSGSYMYNCHEPWQSYFASTGAHNALTVDGFDQMTAASRFVWFDWTKSRFVARGDFDSGFVQMMQAEHYGYRRRGIGVLHRRSVLSIGALCWFVVDDIVGKGEHKVDLYWQLAKFDYELKGSTLILQTDHGPVCVTVLDSTGAGQCRCFSGNDKPIGWQSLYYGNRNPAPALVCSQKAALPVRLVTVVSLGDVIKHAALSQPDTASWILETSGQEYIVGLNSIDNSLSNSFAFVKQNDRKVLLD